MPNELPDLTGNPYEPEQRGLVVLTSPPNHPGPHDTEQAGCRLRSFVAPTKTAVSEQLADCEKT